MNEPAASLIACPTCGQIQYLPTHDADERVHCARCHKRLPLRRGGWLPLTAACVALVFLPAALLLPIMQIERLGLRHETSILGGIDALLQSGRPILAAVVLFFSVLIPLAKLSGLACLLLPRLWRGIASPVRQRWIYEAVEASSRWGMVDVLLVAILIAVVKLGDLVSVTPGPGLAAFTVVVLGSMLASLSLHPHELWEIDDAG